jgi:predicted RND superfamily exporter protein
MSSLARGLDRLLRRPGRLLLVLLVVTLCSLPLLRRLNLQGDLVDMLPRSSQAAQTFARFTRDLGAGQELLILVTAGANDRARLPEFADAYAAALAQHPDVQQVTHRISGASLTYLRDHLYLLLNDRDLDELARRIEPAALAERAARLRGLLTAPGGSAMAPLLTTDPLELIPLVAGRLQAQSGLPVDAQSGYLRTADGSALILKVRPRFAPFEWQRGEALVKDAVAIAARLGAQAATQPATGWWPDLLRRLGPLGSDPQVTRFASDDTAGLRVAFTGAYAFPPYYRRWIEGDMTRSTVLSVGAVLLLFALFFRSLRILPWVLLPLGFAGLWTAVAATFLFGRLSGVSMAFSSILVAIGIDLPIQLYSRLREELAPSPGGTGEPDIAATVRQTACRLAGPSIVATLGPAAVFIACGLSDYQGLNQLGVLAGLGLLLNAVAMLTIFPALLLLLPPRLWWRRLPPLKQERGILSALGRLGTARPRLVLLVSAGLLLLALPFARSLHFSERLFALEPGDMPPALTQAELSRRFGEQQRFMVVLISDRDPDGALLRADRWQAAVEELRQRGALRGYESVSALVPSDATQNQRRRRLASLNLPQAATALEGALSQAGFDTAAFADALARLRAGANVTPGGALSLAGLAATELGFLVRTHVADLPAERLVALYLFVPVDSNLQSTVATLQSLAADPRLGGQLTGLPLLERELTALLSVDLLRVCLASIAAVVLLLALYYRRLRPTLAVLLPLSVAWALFAAALALCGIPLNLYNLIAIPLCIGYGIDDHIFLVHRHEATPAAERSPARVLATTGRAIVLTTLATVAGFAGLIPAHFLGLRHLGLAGALAVLLCLAAALLVLPALLHLFWPTTRGAPDAPSEPPAA